MLQRLRGGRDYFGNPGGFTPFLSLQSTVKLYKDETQRSLKALLLAKEIEKKKDKIQSESELIEATISTFNEDTKVASEQIIEIEGDVQNFTKSINDLEQKLKLIGNRLENLPL